MKTEEFLLLDPMSQADYIKQQRATKHTAEIAKEMGVPLAHLQQVQSLNRLPKEMQEKVRARELGMAVALLSLLNDEDRTHVLTLQEMESDDPQIAKFRQVFKRLEKRSKVDSWGGMECVRKFNEWKKAGRPMIRLSERLGGG